jgi:hypothetical protein
MQFEYLQLYNRTPSTQQHFPQLVFLHFVQLIKTKVMEERMLAA